MSMNKFIMNGSEGGNLLFCGSGFSASSLNFASEELGAAWPLLKAMNDALDYQYSDMQIAADEYVEKFGEHGLLALLQSKFSVSKRTKAADVILQYPWTRIYTTNYDDLISQSLTSQGRQHYVANNTETPFDIRKIVNHENWVIHIHGALKKWDIKNFARSCVLGRESYLRASSGSNWGEELRRDYVRAKAVFFIGFSNSDFYLAENLFSAEASRDKVFFINSDRSSEDRELLAKQKRFGEPMALGIDKFSELISNQLRSAIKPPLQLHNFEPCELPQVREERGSVEQQYSFIVSGQETPEAHIKDIVDHAKSYRAPRTTTDEVIDHLKQENAVALISGGLCSGKSIFFEECIMKMLIAGDTVFRLRNRFNDMASEVRKILMEQPGCTIAIDDCYSLREDLDRIVGEVNSAGAKLLLTSRTLAHDSARDIRRNMLEDTPYRTFDIDILNTHEIDDLIDCTDRIGGWGSTVQSRSQKRKIIEREKNSRLAGFILGVFQADHIRQRFKSELDYFKGSGLSAEKLLIIAMYLKSIGTSVQESVLSELLQLDALSVLNRTGGPNSHQHEFISFDSKSKAFELIASINARDALRNLFDEQTVTSAIIEAIQNMEKVRHEPAFKHIFSQFMRYTQLQLVVNSREEQDRFFDRLSEIYFCKNHVLFWLQWSMAMRDHGKYPRAYQYLEEAYGRAHERDFDTEHLDDQKAGLLLDSIKENAGSADFLRSFRESATLLNKMISKGADTPHNYQTITSFDPFFEKWGGNFDAAHGPIALQTLNVLKSSVEKQITRQQSGFAKTCMEVAVETIARSADMVSRKQ